MQDDSVLSEEEIKALLDNMLGSGTKKNTPPSDCPGFLLIHKTDATGRVTGIEIREVLIRKNSNFYRYKKDDAKSRSRAMDQARAAADYETATFDLEPFTLIELPGSDVEKTSLFTGKSIFTSVETSDKIFGNFRNIFKNFNEDQKAKQPKDIDIMCQAEIEILLEGVRLGQRMQCK